MTASSPESAFVFEYINFQIKQVQKKSTVYYFDRNVCDNGCVAHDSDEITQGHIDLVFDQVSSTLIAQTGDVILAHSWGSAQ